MRECATLKPPGFLPTTDDQTSEMDECNFCWAQVSDAVGDATSESAHGNSGSASV